MIRWKRYSDSWGPMEGTEPNLNTESHDRRTPYQRPVLRRFGSFAELTRGVNADFTDEDQGSS